MFTDFGGSTTATEAWHGERRAEVRTNNRYQRLTVANARALLKAVEGARLLLKDDGRRVRLTVRDPMMGGDFPLVVNVEAGVKGGQVEVTGCRPADLDTTGGTIERRTERDGVAALAWWEVETNNGFVPTGNHNGAPLFTNMLYSSIAGTSVRWRATGLIYREQPSIAKMLYCPEQSVRNSFYSWESNRAAIRNPDDPYTAFNGATLQTGYSSYWAPDWTGANLGSASASGGKPFVKASKNLYKNAEFYPPVQSVPTAYDMPGPIGGILADRIANSGFLAGSHDSGMNVLYADYAVSFVDAGNASNPKDLRYYTSPALWNGAYNGGDVAQKIWTILSVQK